jgi:hypothetical protein
MISTEVTAIANLLSGLPLHTILMIAVIALWKRVNILQEKLDQCLSVENVEKKKQH